MKRKSAIQSSRPLMERQGSSGDFPSVKLFDHFGKKILAESPWFSIQAVA
jgi:hypothetical protein